MFPAGPTIIDQVANSSFWLGLMNFFKYNLSEDISELMDFKDARSNFYASAQ